MLSSLYRLSKPMIATLIIGGAITFMLLTDPPHHMCDTQKEHFKEVQKGTLYKNSKDIHSEKSRLERKKQICQKENSPGSCYEYFYLLKKILKDLRLVSLECKQHIFSETEVKKGLSSALTLMTALAWRQELLSGRLSKFNWLTKPDMYLFCEIKRKYTIEYGKNTYKNLENEILNLLPVDTKNKQDILKWSLLSESCLKYR